MSAKGQLLIQLALSTMGLLLALAGNMENATTYVVAGIVVGALRKPL